MTARSGTSFRLTLDRDRSAADRGRRRPGTIDFQHTDAGLVNTNYQSTQPPPQLPDPVRERFGLRNSSLSARLVPGDLGHALARLRRADAAGHALELARRRVQRRRLDQPLRRAFQGQGAGVPGGHRRRADRLRGHAGGRDRRPVRHARRATTYWVRGVGPVRTVLRHASGETSTAELLETNLKPLPLPSDVNLLPLNRGDSGTLRWRNSKHMKAWSTQKYSVSEVVNSTARVDVKHVSGPIRVAAAYAFATRLSGVTLLSGSTRSTRRKCTSSPKLAAPTPAPLRHAVRPDGVRLQPGRAADGDGQGRDLAQLAREPRLLDLRRHRASPPTSASRRVRVPAGKFKATAIRTTLSQSGSPFGSGTRTS